MELNINQFCNVAVTPDDGQRVFNSISPAIQSGQPVVLNFAGVTVFAASFFNRAIGQLLRDHTRAELKKLLVVKNLTADGANVVRQAIDNAEKYYGSEEYRNKQRAVVESIAEGE
jgi:hypothetical protein